MGTDFRTLATRAPSTEGATLTVLHPATRLPLGTEDRPITITLAGVDSDQYRAASQAATNRRMEVASRKRQYTLDAAQVDAEAIELVVACVIGWEGVTLDGQELPCTPANARRLFEECPWLRADCEAFIGDRSHFFGTSPTSSPPSPGGSVGA